MMAEYVLRVKRKDNSDGEKCLDYFSCIYINLGTYDRESSFYTFILIVLILMNTGTAFVMCQPFAMNG